MSALLAQTRLVLRNDLRLWWRDLRAGKSKLLTNGLLIGLILLVLHTISLFVFFNLRTFPPLGAEAGVWAFFGFLMLGGAMNQAISLFFERADFDLLLSSPLPARAVLLARISVMSLAAFAGAALLLLPLLNGIIIGFSLTYLAGYATWALLAILVASLGVWITLALVRALGPRRARVWIQIAAALLGASVFILLQTQNYLPMSQRKALWLFLAQAIDWLGLAHHARAGRGELLQLLPLAAISLLAVALTARQLSRVFLTGLQESENRPTRARPAKQRAYRFKSGIARATFFKDLRLIARDPLLLSQILPSLMYILPAFLGFRNFGAITVLAPISVALAVQFSTLLADVAANGEECLDLIRMSPSPEKKLRLAKMAAGMALPVLVSALLCLAIALLGRPFFALLVFGTGVMTAAGASWLSVTRVAPVARKDILSRQRPRRSFARGATVGALLISACTGVAMVAHGTLWLIGLAIIGATALGVIACFTLVEIEDLPSEENLPTWKLPHATTS